MIAYWKGTRTSAMSVRIVLIACGTLGLSSLQGAEPLADVSLDLDTMNSLGFSLNAFREDELRFAQLRGPRDMDGCPARRAGSYLFDLAGEMIAFQSVWFEANDDGIELVAEISFGNASAHTQLFIDYICTDAAGGTRYTLKLPEGSAEDR